MLEENSPSDDNSKALSVLDGEEENRDDFDYAYGSEFDRDVVTALHAIKEDFGRQLGLASDRQNSMIQSIGIILAFASILLIEVIRTAQLNTEGIPGLMALVSFLSCCSIGVATIWNWRNWEMYTGFDQDEVVDSFNDWRFIDVHGLLLNGVTRSYDAVINNNYILKERITGMVIALFAGIVLMLIGMVMQWA